MKHLALLLLIFGTCISLSAQKSTQKTLTNDLENENTTGEWKHRICLSDDYGDGWNGGYVDVYVNGSPVLVGISLPSGAGPECHTFTACNNADINVYYTAGGWPYENSYEIYDPTGQWLAESGSYGSTPSSILIKGNCPVSPPDCCEHEICLTDSYGDGWNGATVDVHVNGIPVLVGLTLGDGFGPGCYTFNACASADIDVFYTAGGWPEENYYAIYDGYGVKINESGVGGLPPGNLLDLEPNCPPSSADCCDHSICLSDDYGDGWNGGTVSVFVDGSPVLSNITLASGAGPECFAFTACTGSEIDVYYYAGSWAYENEYAVYDASGELLGESGTGGIQPSDYIQLSGNCPEPQPLCCDHHICLSDEYGDGWEGGSVDVFVDGSLVLDDITLLSGSGPECLAFTACYGADIDVYYTAGNYAYENSFQVFDGYGTLLGESGTLSTTPGDVLDMIGNCPSPLPEGCEHQICLNDDYGDGWNGGSIDVFVDGNLILDNVTLASGLGPECFTFSADQGANIEIYFTAGNWAYENSYSVYDGLGALLGSSGIGGVEPVSLLQLNGNCNVAPSDCCEHTICMVDDYGDGWEGGSLDVLVDGTLVLDNITLPSGYGPVCYAFTACSGEQIQIQYTAGGYPEENAYILYDGNGNFLAESGSGGVIPAAGIFVGGSCPSLTPPENDLCIDAIPIDCNSTLSGSTIGATFDDVGDCVISTTAPGVWYTFEATSSTAILSTCNQADYDTKISVFTGSCGNLVCVDGQDDAMGCSGYTTLLEVNTIPGEIYMVLVHGYYNATGNFDLTLICPCEIYVPPQPPFENMTGNTLSATDDPSLVGWTVDNPGWTITSPANQPTIEYTAGTGSAEFTVTYDNGNLYTCKVTITSIPAWEYCTMTQGFYGNGGGSFCDGNSTEQLLTTLLAPGLTIGVPSENSLILTQDDVDCLIGRLPASGPPAIITKPSTCGNPAGIKLHGGKPPRRFKNTLVGQAITLGLNMQLSDVGSMVMTSRFLTTAASSGCGTYNGPNHPVNEDWRYNEIPMEVYIYLGTDPTIEDLFNLANDALGDLPVGGLSFDDITLALAAINDGFDGCMFGTFEGGYWPPQIQNTEAPSIDDPYEVSALKHKVYPNPFNDHTIIEFTLPQASNVVIEIYSISGIRLETILDRYVDEGLTTTVDYNSGHLPQGIYIYLIHTNQGSFRGKMIKQ